jgi:nicotinate-nucleotide adenylyltransferase
MEKDKSEVKGVAEIKKETEAANRRIGLFGGTFNPIHLGHLRGAEEIRESFDLQEVIFIPAAIPPHKEIEEVIEARHRLEMVRLATASNSHFSVMDIELKRPGKSYSIETIRYFQERYPDGLYFILGRDAFVEIETWKNFQQLFSLSNFIVMTRPGLQRASSTFQLPGTLVSFFQFDQKVKGWIHPSGHTLHFKEISYLDISSTKIRELIERGESVRYLIPPEVEAYIQQYRLYRKSG